MVEIRRAQGVLRSMLRVIPKTDLAKQLDPVNTETWLREVDRYLSGEHQMSARKAFLIGEALNKLGAGWCSGFWMLWVSGHYEDVIAILVVSTRRFRPFNGNEIDHLWHMLALASRLALSTSLDEIAPFPEWYVLGEGLPQTILDEVNRWALGQPDGHHAATRKACIAFLERELAKIAWLEYDWFRRDFTQSFDIWCTQGPIHQQIVLDTVPFTAMALSRDTTLPLVSRELAILTLVGHWLTCMETGFLYNLYPRPVRSEYSLERLIPEGTWFVDDANNRLDWITSLLVDLFESRPDLVIPRASDQHRDS